MKLTEARILYLARESLNRLCSENLIDAPNFSLALRQAREAISRYLEQGDALDAIVRRKIASLKRGVAQGTAEYDILYRRYSDEERRKKGPTNR